MSQDSNRIQVTLGVESTKGTAVALTATNQDVRWELSGGQTSVDLAKASKGTIAEGGFNVGQSHRNQQSCTFPEMKTSFKKGADKDTQPPLWKYLEACGYTIIDNGLYTSLVWNTYPTDSSLTVNFKVFDDGAVTYGGDGARGALGNVSIGADTPNGEIYATLSGLVGAWTGTLDGTGMFAATGINANAVETMDNYILTLGSQPYTVQNWKTELNCDNKPEGGNNTEGIEAYKAGNQTVSCTMQITELKKSVSDVAGDTAIDTVYPTIKLAGQAGAGFDFIWTDCDVTEVPNSDSDGTLCKTIKFNYQLLSIDMI